MNISCTKINPSSIISPAPPDYCDYWWTGRASSCCGGKARSALGSGGADAVFPLMDTISGYLGFWALGWGVYFGWGKLFVSIAGLYGFPGGGVVCAGVCIVCCCCECWCMLRYSAICIVIYTTLCHTRFSLYTCSIFVLIYLRFNYDQVSKKAPHLEVRCLFLSEC